MTDRIEENLVTAPVSWTDEGTPCSHQFDDIYFSKADGIKETEYVFLQHNHLPERFPLHADQPGGITIGETGFGTGLNFMCAWRLRDQIAPSCKINFVSVEKYPLSLQDLKKSLSGWSELGTYARQLIEHYPPLIPGWHRIHFSQHGVELNLYFGDAEQGYRNYQGNIDAWFLDGFAPAKNPEMWSEQLFTQLSRLSNVGTTFSTFTAAAQVREGLRKAGFEVQRVKGFARKKHMLCGDLTTTDTKEVSDNHTPPWFSVPRKINSPDHQVAVIGAGLAGSSAAFSLSSRGWQVSVFEAAEHPAEGASGNRQGVLYCKLSARPSLASDFYRSGYLFSSRQIPQLMNPEEEGRYWQRSGVLQLAWSPEEAERQSRFISLNPQPDTLVYPVTPEQASVIADTEIRFSGLYYPNGYWVTPAAFCRAQLGYAGISTHFNSGICRLERSKESWLLFDKKDRLIAQSTLVVIANAIDALKFEQTAFLPLKSIRGQTTEVPSDSGTRLKSVVCGKGYIGPKLDNRYHIGATFNLNSSVHECRPEDHLTNLQQVATLVPELARRLNFTQLSGDNLTGRVGFRTTSPDYLPIVGPVPDHNAYLENYGSLGKDTSKFPGTEARYLPGLYVTLAHGSKGLSSAPLAGELIAACMTHTPAPIATEISQALHPARFIIRDLKRNKIRHGVDIKHQTQTQKQK